MVHLQGPANGFGEPLVVAEQASFGSGSAQRGKTLVVIPAFRRDHVRRSICHSQAQGRSGNFLDERRQLSLLLGVETDDQDDGVRREQLGGRP